MVRVWNLFGTPMYARNLKSYFLGFFGTWGVGMGDHLCWESDVTILDVLEKLTHQICVRLLFGAFG